MIGLYLNAAGQRGAEIMVFTGSILIIEGVVNNVVVVIYWLKGKREKNSASVSFKTKNLSNNYLPFMWEENFSRLFTVSLVWDTIEI